MTFDEILSYFPDAKKSGRSYKCKCPLHADKQASLVITPKDDRTLMNDLGGCKTQDILAAKGLKVSDLFYEAKSSRRREVASYSYYDRDGNKVADKLKYRSGDDKKDFKWKQSENNWSMPKIPLLYNWQNVKEANKLYFVEGEKDVDTLTCLNLPAVSVPDGAKSWQKEHADFFTGKDVVIIPDNDKAGEELANNCINDIIELAKSVKVVNLANIWADMPEKADFTDFVKQGGDVQALIDLAEKVEPLAIQSAYVDFKALKPTKTKWLWYPYIPRGKITLMTADPGTGKTFFTLYIAAMVTNGEPFFGSEDFRARQCVVYQSNEDGLADTLLPRLLLFKPEPDLDNFTAYDEEQHPLDFSMTDTIEKIMRDKHPALMIFDPLQAYLGADVDMHRANQVRPVLAKLGHLAEKYDCAIMLIMHNSKMSTDPLYRALGSIDFVGIARSMLVMGRHPDNREQRVICHEKSSLAAPGQSIVFHIDPENGGVVFDGFSELTAVDVLNAKKSTRKKAAVTQEEAVSELQKLLGSEGWVELSQVKTLEAAAGISERTMYRAKKELGLDTVRIGYSDTMATYWLHPDVDKEKFRQERLFTGAVEILGENEDLFGETERA